MELYKYINIINPKIYLGYIEKKANKENKWSWEILLEDMDNNVIENDYIFEFKNNINKSIKKMDIYIKNKEYNKLENEHNENMILFWKLQNIEIKRMILMEKPDHFLKLKKEIYEKINIIYNILLKLQLKNINEKQEYIFINILKETEHYYKCIINILFYYYNIRNVIPTDDYLLCKNINVLNFENVSLVKYTIENNIKVYKNVKLPKNIIEKRYKSIKSSKKIINILDHDILVFVKHIIKKTKCKNVFNINKNNSLIYDTSEYVFSNILIDEKYKYLLLYKKLYTFIFKSYFDNFNSRTIFSWKEILSWIS